MPPPKHPLRLIRAATPWAGAGEFAQVLGVPAAALTAVERGKAALTARLAALIMEKTGADDAALLAGRALTVQGRKFTAESFAAWQGSAAQAAERARRETQQQAHMAGWSELCGGDPDKASPEQIAAAEAALVPWQTCEFGSAAAGAWKRLPDSLQRLTGWSGDLPFAAKTRLTLGVQSAPAWNPDAPPPDQAAGNADLFPPCCFTVAAGSGGCRMAAAFWRAVCREHGLSESEGVPCSGGPTGNWRGFFRSDGGRCVPHAVFAGMEESEAAPLRGRPFHSHSVLTGGDEHALTPQVMEFMQQFSADAGSPAGILLFASLEGGTASALTSSLLRELRARFPAVPLLVIGVLPLPGRSHVATAPWHVALAMQAIRQCADAAVLFSNEQLLAQARRDWKFPAPGYEEANLLIAEALTALTAPLRFGGTDTAPADLATLLACFAQADGSQPVITGAVWPQAALMDRRLREITLPWLQRALAAEAFGPAAGLECAALFLKARTAPRPGWIVSDEPIVLKPDARIQPGNHASAAVFAPQPVIARTLRRLQREARAVFVEWTAGRLNADPGIPQPQLEEAIQDMTGDAGTRMNGIRHPGENGTLRIPPLAISAQAV